MKQVPNQHERLMSIVNTPIRTSSPESTRTVDRGMNANLFLEILNCAYAKPEIRSQVYYYY
jgi:hypothetical protein